VYSHERGYILGLVLPTNDKHLGILLKDLSFGDHSTILLFSLSLHGLLSVSDFAQKKKKKKKKIILAKS
jgi:hypothetical protein